MRATRFIPLALVCSAIGLLFACSSSEGIIIPPPTPDATTPDATVIYVYLEASTPDSTIAIPLDSSMDGSRHDATTIVDDDSGEPGEVCAPIAVPAYTFKSPGKYLGKCTDLVLKTLFDACISDTNTISGCDAAKAQFADCSACAFGEATDATQHPWLVYDDRVTAFANFGLCMATIKGESAASDCGIAYGQFYTCLNAACVTPCATLQDPDAFDTCRQVALDNSTCTAGSATALGTKCMTKYDDSDPTYGFCTSVKDEQGNDFDDRGYMVAIARLTCGFDPKTDGGLDAGPDADASKGSP